MAKLTGYEKETIIRYNQLEDSATIFTYHTALQNKLNALVGTDQNIAVVRKGNDDNEFVEYQVPCSWVKISPPRKRNLTDEQRAEAAERLANARKKKNE